ncbi:hypothetical protein HPB50_009430 [Hyalomma asiaticum]|uniref:Uncharacterized protein n=1 Tax=Hyalomma asiaticum TaxID=266040 RepID=A0ACB7RTS7_HYAAI|nr:hypothetical protein HPB50_009430 [Hyalomma asiaticum]
MWSLHTCIMVSHHAWSVTVPSERRGDHTERVTEHSASFNEAFLISVLLLSSYCWFDCANGLGACLLAPGITQNLPSPTWKKGGYSFFHAFSVSESWLHSVAGALRNKHLALYRYRRIDMAQVINYGSLKAVGDSPSEAEFGMKSATKKRSAADSGSFTGTVKVDIHDVIDVIDPIDLQADEVIFSRDQQAAEPSYYVALSVDGMFISRSSTKRPGTTAWNDSLTADVHGARSLAFTVFSVATTRASDDLPVAKGSVTFDELVESMKRANGHESDVWVSAHF